MTSLLPNYVYNNIIGHGTFGYVFEAFDKTNQKKVAIKRIQKVSKQLSREYEVLLTLKGVPHIIQIEDIFLSQTEDGLHVQNIVFDFRDRSLESIIQQHLKKRILINPNLIKSLSYQLLTGLANMHERQVIHRDLKPENILVDKKEYLEICDFGSAKILNDNQLNTPYVVSQYYRAPELILSHSNYGYSIDIWAAGCILAEIANLQVLFEGQSEGDQLYCIFQLIGSLQQSEMEYLFGQIQHGSEIQKRFVGYPGQTMRQWYNQFRNIPNVEQFVDLLLSLIHLNPLKRITAQQALQHPYFK